MSGGGQERQTLCTGSGGNRLAIQSWWIHLLRSDNHYVQFIQVYCDSLPTPLPPTNWGPRLDFGTKLNDIVEMVTGGPFGTQPPFQACPAGEVAVGIRVRAGEFLDAIGLICGPLPVKLGAPSTTVIPDAKMFIITKPAFGDRVPQDQLVIPATLPKVGATNVTELELTKRTVPGTVLFLYLISRALLPFARGSAMATMEPYAILTTAEIGKSSAS